MINKIVTTIINALSGVDNETAGIKRHKLRFRFFKWRLYKVWATNTDEVFYLITEDMKMPKYKYKAFRITGGLKRLNDNLFYWRMR